MRFYKRVIGGVSRRLGRPELLAAVDAGARTAQQEAIGIAAILAASLRGDGTYIDVGTNRGQVLGEAVRVAPGARHIAFEPIPGLAAEVASAFPGVDCRPMALGARREVTQFCHFTLLDGWSGLRRYPGISDSQGRPEYFDVQVSTLDEELDGISPDVVKIDVEGAELAVLQGGRSVIADARPLIIFEHVPDTAALYGYSPGELWDLLSDLGYRIFSVTGEGPFARQGFTAAHDIVNWLAAPPGSA